MSSTPWSSCARLCALLVVAACSDQPTAPTTSIPKTSVLADRKDSKDVDPAVVRAVRDAAAGRGIVALARPASVRPQLSRLGQALLFDPILSGNREHLVRDLPPPVVRHGRRQEPVRRRKAASSFGPARAHPTASSSRATRRRCSTSRQCSVCSGTGASKSTRPAQLQTPAGTQITPAMRACSSSAPASALGMFPVTNRAEMRGLRRAATSSRSIPDADLPAIWTALMRRLGAIPEYRAMFEAAYPGHAVRGHDVRARVATPSAGSWWTPHRSTTRRGIASSPGTIGALTSAAAR